MDDKTRLFRAGFEALAERLNERYYTSVADFSRDFSRIVLSVLAPQDKVDDLTDADIEAIHSQLNEAPPGTAEHSSLTQEQKDLKRITKRIIKPVKELLEVATRKEAELRGRELEEEIRKLDSMGIFASAVTKTLGGDGDEEMEPSKKRRRSGSEASAVAGASPEGQAHGDTEMPDADGPADEAVLHVNVAGNNDTVAVSGKKRRPASKAPSHASSAAEHAPANKGSHPTAPLSPPISRSSSAPNGAAHSISGESESHDVFAQGGVPWYLEPFDPRGTTIHEERYTGREVLRDMSEELSDMDEDTLTELAGSGEATIGSASTPNGAGSATPAQAVKSVKKKSKAKKNQWSRSRR